ncbi:MAG: TetR/AcrR family transcriptional regulator [Ktedonobacteraceae bacterium]|nr:TetR/AcrR family transcriptional regulator [Ktedonobacteraceae bacterium]
MKKDHARSARREEHRQRMRQRRQNEKQKLRQIILDTAGELFLQHGYMGFSLRQVAEEIGYAPGTIYLYFNNKDDLLFNIANEGFRRFNEKQRAARSLTDDPAQKLREMCRAYISFGLEFPTYYRLMFMERPDLLFKKHEVEAYGWLSSLQEFQTVFAEAIQSGVFRQGNIISMSDAWWACLHGIVSLSSSMTFLFDKKRIEQATEEALSMLFEGFGLKSQ